MALPNILGKVKLKFKNVQLGWVYGLALLVLSLDQMSKYLIELNLGPFGSGKTLMVGGGLILKYSKNNGASNNILENTSWLLAFVAALAALTMIFYYHRIVPKSRLQQSAIGLLLGGTLGNLFDRIFKDGFVTDFIYLDWLPYAKNFNLADMAIRSGVIAILVVFVRHIQQPKTHEEAKTN